MARRFSLKKWSGPILGAIPCPHSLSFSPISHCPSLRLRNQLGSLDSAVSGPGLTSSR